MRERERERERVLVLLLSNALRNCTCLLATLNNRWGLLLDWQLESIAHIDELVVLRPVNIDSVAAGESASHAASPRAASLSGKGSPRFSNSSSRNNGSSSSSSSTCNSPTRNEPSRKRATKSSAVAAPPYDQQTLSSDRHTSTAASTNPSVAELESASETSAPSPRAVLPPRPLPLPLSAEEAAEKAAEKALAEDLATNPSARALHALINAAAPFVVSSLIAFI